MGNSRAAFFFAAALAALLPIQFVAAEETGEASESADLAKKLSNPVADLISVPMKLDWNTGIGPANADQEIYVVLLTNRVHPTRANTTIQQVRRAFHDAVMRAAR